MPDDQTLHNPTIVVGDRFSDFASNPHVLPVSVFLDQLANSGTHDFNRTPWVVVGQGLSQRALLAITEATPHPVIDRPLPQPASSAQTHKRAGKNILISAPKAVDGQTYRCDLFLDDSNEVMEDHQTGQHIQGLALIEAARQLWTAVSEEFLLPKDRKTRFVIDSLNTTFSNFVFPLPCAMTLEVLGVEKQSFQSLFQVRITFIQNGTLTTQVDARYRVIDERISARQEAIAARKAVDHTIEPMLALPV